MNVSTRITSVGSKPPASAEITWAPFSIASPWLPKSPSRNLLDEIVVCAPVAGSTFTRRGGVEAFPAVRTRIVLSLRTATPVALVLMRSPASARRWTG